MSDEMPTEKRCTKCSEIKSLEAFCKHTGGKYGRNSRCRACAKAHNAAHADHLRICKRAWREANAEKMREYLKNYGVGYRAATLEKMREYQSQYRETHREKARDYMRQYRVNNPEVSRARDSKRRARLKGNGGTFTAQELKAMRAEQNGICAYCKHQYDPDALSMDHIIPISRGGRHEAPNICLACPRCNSSKSNKFLSEWTNRWYERDDE